MQFYSKDNTSINLNDVKDLIVQGESQTVELKRSLSQLKPAIETVCAFLNTNGGVVIIGANQKGELTGNQVSDNTQQEIAKELAKIEPSTASVKVNYIPINNNNQQLVILSTNLGDDLPYVYDGRPFYRNQTSTMRMSQQQYTQLLLEKGIREKDSWEMQLNKSDNINQLDHEEIKRTVKIAVNSNRLDADALYEPIEDTLQKLELMRDGYLTNAAMVLFGQSVLPEFPQCLIKMARFRGTKETEGFIDNQMIHGNAFQIMKAANEFIMKHLSVASFFDENKLERIDEPTIPILAIREALSNAISHRDYSVHNAAIMLAIFDDRMEIWNNGTLPSSLTIEDLKKRHKSYPRNKRIARVFYMRHYIETWGTGTIKMIELCRKNNLPEPVFEEYSSGFSVTFQYKSLIGKESLSIEEDLKPRQQTILSLIKYYDGLSANMIMKYLDNPPSLRMIRKDLNTLRELGLIQLEGYGRSALWKSRH